jgi:DNA-binding MarR family transcriptional regulator
MEINESLLRAIFATIGRGTFAPQQVYRLVTPHGGSDKQLAAYNLCDGNTQQADIAKKAKLDKGTTSRALSRWIESGIVVRIGKDQLPLHVYPLSKETLKAVKE